MEAHDASPMPLDGHHDDTLGGIEGSPNLAANNQSNNGYGRRHAQSHSLDQGLPGGGSPLSGHQHQQAQQQQQQPIHDYNQQAYQQNLQTQYQYPGNGMDVDPNARYTTPPIP